MTTEQKKLIDHISRLEGQLASVKAELKQAQPDCRKASQTLLSASRSFAGLRELFVTAFLRTHFIGTKKRLDEQMFKQLLTLSKG